MLDSTLPGAAARPSPAYHRRRPQPVLVLLGVLALLLGGAGLGSVTSQPASLLAASQSGRLVLQDTDSHFVWSAGWQVASSRSASGGTVHISGKAGATASLVYYGSYIEILGPTGKGAGTLAVTLDGMTRPVSTHGTVFHAQHVIFAAGPAGNRHVLTLRVVGTAGHPYVSIDSVAISGAQAAMAAARKPAVAQQPTVVQQPTATPTPTAAPTTTSAPPAAPTPTAAPAPTPTAAPPASNQKVVQFPLSGSQSSFESLMKDMSIDVIEMAPGTYHGWHLEFSIDRTARPLTIRPAQGTVVFDGTGSSSREGLITAGWSGYTAHITFSGPFQINNYTINQTGLIETDWANYLTFNGFSVHGTQAPSTNGLTAWAVYVSSDGTHRGSSLTFDNWNVDNTQSDHKVNGLQLYHTPQAIGVTALNWTVSGGYWGFVGRGNATGVDIEGWQITGTSGPSFDSNGPAGIVRNMHATNSGSPVIDAPMVNGGGNVWK